MNPSSPTIPSGAGGPSAFHRSLQASNLKRIAAHDAHMAKLAKGNVVLPTPSHPTRKPKLIVPGMPNQSAATPSMPMTPPVGF